MTDRLFAYRAVRPDGVAVRASVRAPDEAEAMRRLARDGLTVTDLKAERAAAPGRARATLTERALIMRQLAVMLRAGVDMLEALESVAAALDGRDLADQLRDVAAALRRGDRVSAAFQAGLTGYPDYVYALIAAGDASGRLDEVLAQAAEELAFEDRTRREIQSALAYPAFLVVAGVAAMAFLFLWVVPRFATMIGPRAAEAGGLAGFVLGLASVSPIEAGVAALALVGAAIALARAATTPAGRAGLARAIEAAPGFGPLWGAAQRARWARIMAFSLEGGVGLLQAAGLAEAAAPPGRFRDGLTGAVRALRAGKPVETAFGEAGALAPIDVSLLRVGQRSGALPAMFREIAQRHEADLKDALKRVTVLMEQGAIALVAATIGVVVLSLVTAMTGVYESIG